MTREKRLHPRAKVQFPAEIRTAINSEWEKVLLHNLSASGAAVHAAAELPGESEVRLRFRLPGNLDDEGRDFEILCLVVRTAPVAGSELPVLLGLYFLTLHGEEFEYIRRWVWFHIDQP